MENASECLLKLIEMDNYRLNGVRKIIVTTVPASIPDNKDLQCSFVQSVLNLISTSENEYCRMFMMKALTQLLTTAKLEDSNCQTFQLSSSNEAEWKVVQDTCSSLVASCRSASLLETATALDGFYEIFSEPFYDVVLKEHDVLGLMTAGTA